MRNQFVVPFGLLVLFLLCGDAEHSEGAERKPDKAQGVALLVAVSERLSQMSSEKAAEYLELASKQVAGKTSESGASPGRDASAAAATASAIKAEPPKDPNAVAQEKEKGKAPSAKTEVVKDEERSPSVPPKQKKLPPPPLKPCTSMVPDSGNDQRVPMLWVGWEDSGYYKQKVQN